MRRNLRDARILITGASSGIGRALALELSPYEPRLLLTARREDRLASLTQELQSLGCDQVASVAGDITEPQTRERLMSVARQTMDGLDILVNNAGAGAYGPFANAPSDRLHQLMDVNFFAAVELTRSALPILCHGRAPLIVNVGSVLGHVAVPNKSEYCASKFALHGFSDALRCELAREGVDVLLVSPSTTSSEFFERLVDQDGEPQVNRFAMTPEAVARKTVAAMRSGRREVILSWGGKLLVLLDRVAPTLMNWILSRGNQGASSQLSENPSSPDS